MKAKYDFSGTQKIYIFAEKSILKTHRYFVHLAYKGTHYHGWQIQPNAVTLQQVLNEAFSTILREQINLIGAGRTDAGVHASSFYAHFDLSGKSIEDPSHLKFKLNCYLPKDITIYSIFPVHNKAHSRFDATARTYRYFITTVKDPFRTEIAYHLFKKVSVETMNEACKILFQYKDFTSFSKSNTQTKTNLCEIYKAEWTQTGSDLTFEIRANRFLRNMVRAIVGTMINIGEKKLTLENFKTIIESKDRSRAGYSIPANGLFLTSIDYPSTIYKLAKEQEF